MKSLRLPLRHALAVACMTPALVWAGGTAVMEVTDGTDRQQVTYEFDGSNVRMSLPEGAEGYALIRGETPYMVMTGDQLMVMDLSQAMKMLGGMVKVPEGPAEMDGFVSLKDTGRSETVAGVGGKVYLATYTEDGQQKTAEMVLSSDRRAREFTNAMMGFARSMVKAGGRSMPEGSTELERQMAAGELGILRMGTEMRLTRLDGNTPAASRFELPAAPTQMPSLEGLFGGAGAGANVDAGSEGGGGGFNLGGMFGKKIERQQERVEGRTDQEVDEATDSAVDKALDKAFGKLFGG